MRVTSVGNVLVRHASVGVTRDKIRPRQCRVEDPEAWTGRCRGKATPRPDHAMPGGSGLPPSNELVGSGFTVPSTAKIDGPGGGGAATTRCRWPKLTAAAAPTRLYGEVGALHPARPDALSRFHMRDCLQRHPHALLSRVPPGLIQLKAQGPPFPLHLRSVHCHRHRSPFLTHHCDRHRAASTRPSRIANSAARPPVWTLIP
jgi:hypothetical protein